MIDYEEERSKRRRKKLDPDQFDKCCDCRYFTGKYVTHTVHKGKDKCEVWECAIHPGCNNTRFSLACSDYTGYSMV